MTDGPAEDHTLRSFARVMLGAAVLGAIASHRRELTVAIPLLLVGAGLALVVISQVAPRTLAGTYRAGMALGEALGRLTTPVLLSRVCVCVLVPTRLLLALVSKDPLARRFDRDTPTYWSERKRRSFAREDFERLW